MALLSPQPEGVGEGLDRAVAQRVDKTHERHRARVVRLCEGGEVTLDLLRAESRGAERLLKARPFRAARALGGTVLREEQLGLVDARNVELHEAAELVGKIDVLHRTVLAQ